MDKLLILLSAWSLMFRLIPEIALGKLQDRFTYLVFPPTLRLALVIVFCFPFFVQAQEETPNPKILILNGSWNAGAWDLAVTSQIVNSIRDGRYANAEVSIQYLGLNTMLDSAGADRELQMLRGAIRAMVYFQDVTMIVAVASSASELVLGLEIDENIPKILLLPDSATIDAAQGRTDIAIVQSASSDAIESTLDQILDLRPTTRTIHVIGGTNADNLTYVDRTRQIAQQFNNRLDFVYHLGEIPDVLVDKLRNIGAESSVLALPISSYTDNDGQLVTLGPTNYREMIASIQSPVFAMYDTHIGHGLTGGSVSSSDSYARTVAALLEERIETGRWEHPITESQAEVIYDFERAEQFNLNLDRLRTPYTLINQPTTLYDTNPALVIVSANILVFLIALICFMALMLDRSSKARAIIANSERLARENEERYRLLATNTVDVIWTWDINTREVTYCSPSVEKLTGFTVDEILTKNIDEIFTPESAAYCQSFYRNVDNPRDQLIEVEHNTKSGDTIWCELAAHAIDDENSNLWVGVTRDISQRKLSDEHHAKLEASVRQNQKFESLGTLAGGIAHDFNNVLTVIVGLIEMLGKKASGDEEINAIVGKLSKSTNQATRLVQRILTFSRQKEGERCALDMTELTKECAEFLESGVPPQVTLLQNIPDDEMPVVADKTQVEQIILNIITNAIEALGEGGGKIGISLHDQTIHQTTELMHGVLKPGHYAKLSIVDNGAGIPADQLEKIFDPFHSSKELGNGMGLAIVRSIIIDHKGAIGLNSTPGQGTTFDVYLPLTNSEIQQATPNLETGNLSDGLRVLVIDDQENVLEIAKMLLENLGHFCIAMNDPVAAFEYIKLHHTELDLVITDYSMPKLNGIQIVKFCEKHFPNLPAILSSGYGESMSLNEVSPTGNGNRMRILKKPYSYAELRSAIEDVSVASALFH